MKHRTKHANKDLPIRQVNMARKSLAHKTALNLEYAKHVDIILIQEPPIRSLDRRLTRYHPAYETYAPVDTWVDKRPRLLTSGQASVSTASSYVLSLAQTCSSCKSCQGVELLTVINIYNILQTYVSRAACRCWRFQLSAPPLAARIAQHQNLLHKHPDFVLAS